MRVVKSTVACGLRLLCGVAILLGTATLATAATESHYALSLGFDYARGDYGTGETTTSWRMPLTFDYTPTARFDAELVIPYLYQSRSDTVLLGGRRFPMQHPAGQQPMGTTAMAAMPGMGGQAGNGKGGAVAADQSQQGLGDLTLTAGYALVTESPRLPLLRSIVYLKFPTADPDRGLGTGAFDVGGGVSLGKTFGAWSGYAETTYVVVGTTDRYQPKNYWTYLASAAYQLSERLTSGLELSGATSAFDAGNAALEVQWKLNYWPVPRGGFGGYLAKGLSDGSADYGAGLYGAIGF